MPSYSNQTHGSGSKRRSHPYLHGNFAPIHVVQPLTPCQFTGVIPQELAGGQYVRNGGNPVTNEDLGRDAHWFDGDGMLSGVSFRAISDNSIQPEFVNQYILTDAYLSAITTPSLRSPILPSISTLVNPGSSLLKIILRVLRTIILVVFSHLPGSENAIKKISVANTGILYHDGRALATCESGPPMRVSLPTLETGGWFDGTSAEGEFSNDTGSDLEAGETEPLLSKETGQAGVFGGDGLLSFMKEWTTAHPRVDPVTNNLILFHSTFISPFVHYSIIPSTYGLINNKSSAISKPRSLINAAVPGILSPKMMHDFGVSLSHTIIIDLPLSLDPRNLLRNQPVVSYNPSGKSRFGVFPRWQPEKVRWYETSACCIFHTANTWDEVSETTGQIEAVQMIACRLTSANLLFSAGDIAIPLPKNKDTKTDDLDQGTSEEQCRLYYYRFSLSLDSGDGKEANEITQEFALSRIPFEFPSLRESVSMTAAKYIYGCSVSSSSFGAALGRAVKIDSLVKVNVFQLIARGIANPPPKYQCVDNRSVSEILATKEKNDAIQIFKLPPQHYAQECRFVPRFESATEDDGWLLVYVFDETQLDAHGEAPSWAQSELWVIDARDMETIVAKVRLGLRVPYGLHGSWFSKQQVERQRPLKSVRTRPAVIKEEEMVNQSGSFCFRLWMWIRGAVLKTLR